MKQAAADTTEIVGERGVDYLVANGGLVSTLDAFKPIGALYIFPLPMAQSGVRSRVANEHNAFNRGDKPVEIEAFYSQLSQTNVVGNIHLFNLFLPLVLKGTVKKVITITTGLADLDLTNDYEVEVGALYAASKAAMNVIVAKFNAQYKRDGVLFLGISPGLVDTGHGANGTFSLPVSTFCLLV